MKTTLLSIRPSISSTTKINRFKSSRSYVDNLSKSWTYFQSLISVVHWKPWTSRTLCFSRSLFMAWSSFWSCTSLF